MSRKYPLSYPAPQQERFHTKRKAHTRKTLFELIFRTTLLQKYYKKLPGHWFFPILVGTAVTASGHSSMLVRSYALAFCALFLSLDVGLWLFDRPWKIWTKAISFSAACCLWSCLAMGVMYWFLSSTLEDEEADAEHNLTAEVSLPPSGDPIQSLFAVRNGGSTTIAKHDIRCFANGLVGNNGTSILKDYSLQAQWYDGSLPPGDSDTVQCLIVDGFANGVVCLDLTLDVRYKLETQEDVEKMHSFRFVGLYDQGKFFWVKQPVNTPGTFCAKYYHGPNFAPAH
jgi:hypothetical protein